MVEEDLERDENDDEYLSDMVKFSN